MTSGDRWHRFRFSRDEIASGAMGRLLVDSLLPAAEEDGGLDLSTVAIFRADDSEGGKYLYLSPGAFLTFRAIAVDHGAQPCDRPAPEGLSLLYGDASTAWILLLERRASPSPGFPSQTAAISKPRWLDRRSVRREAAVREIPD